MKVSKPVSNYMAQIGSRGGAAGKGDVKRRPAEHYAKAARKRWKKNPPVAGAKAPARVLPQRGGEAATGARAVESTTQARTPLNERKDKWRP